MKPVPCKERSASKPIEMLRWRPAGFQIADAHLAAQHFVDPGQSGILRRVLLAGQVPTQASMMRNVDEAIRVVFATYGPERLVSSVAVQLNLAI